MLRSLVVGDKIRAACEAVLRLNFSIYSRSSLSLPVYVLSAMLFLVLPRTCLAD